MNTEQYNEMNRRNWEQSQARSDAMIADMHRRNAEAQQRDQQANQQQGHGSAILLGLFVLLIASSSARKVFIVISSVVMIAGLVIMLANLNTGDGTGLAVIGAAGLAVGMVSAGISKAAKWLTADIKEEWGGDQ